MKHGTILVFKHTFGQLVEDNVEADESGFEYSIGCHAGIRREFYGEKKPPVIDPAVAQWRLNSLKGTTGAPCPTRKIVPGSVSDEELAREAHYREMAARVRFATPEELGHAEDSAIRLQSAIDYLTT